MKVNKELKKIKKTPARQGYKDKCYLDLKQAYEENTASTCSFLSDLYGAIHGSRNVDVERVDQEGVKVYEAIKHNQYFFLYSMFKFFLSSTKATEEKYQYLVGKLNARILECYGMGQESQSYPYPRPKDRNLMSKKHGRFLKVTRLFLLSERIKGGVVFESKQDVDYYNSFNVFMDVLKKLEEGEKDA